MKLTMRKFFTLLFAMIAFSPIAFAKTVKVEAVTAFSTNNYPSTVKLKALEDINLSADVRIQEGSVMSGKLVDVRSPKRLKRDAKFSFMPMSYVNPNGANVTVNEAFEGKYTTKIEIKKGQVAKNAALTVGNHFVKGISMGYYAVEGAVKNEEGNRFKSSASSLYEHSPFSYVEKGDDLVISIGDVFGLKFKTLDDDDLPEPDAEGNVRGGNFEYTPVE